MNLNIVKYPAPILKKIARPVVNIDSKTIRLINKMKLAQKAAGGYGIAACQLGYSDAIFTFIDPQGAITAAINPDIVETEGSIWGDEGCLSLPKRSFYVQRPKVVVLTFVDVNGDPQTVQATGMQARCLAHEMCHLEGILLTDLVEDNEKQQRALQ